MNTPLNAKMRATYVTALFAFFGGVGVILFVPDWNLAWPFAVVYFVNLYNTYFSVRHFSAIVSPDLMTQRVIDILIGLLYAAVALTMGQPFYFTFFLTLLFTLSAMKYAIELDAHPQPHLLYRKIKINILGIIATLLTIGGIVSGYEAPTALTFVIVFTGAIIYILFIDPVYVLKK